MPDTAIRVLLIEDNPADARLVTVALAESPGARFVVKSAARLSAGLDYLRHDQFDVVLLDLSLPDCPREQTVTRVTTAAARLPIVVLTGLDDERLGREIVKLGAQDYLVKGQFDGRLLNRALFYAIERKRSEEKIAGARDEALEAVGLKSAFLANMSHEIRTPMNAIIGMTRMLLDTALNSDQREFAEVVWSSAHSLLAIINDILDFSKASSGKLRLEEIDFCPAETLEGVIALFAEQIQRAGIELATFVDHAVPARVRGDPVRLRQVLVNLIGNAIKFTDAGEVAVTVDCISASRSDSVLRFSVRDTGPGIAAEAQTRLFQAFYQADGSTTRRHGGTGLGLAISAQIVARMGGEISLESTPGRGSTFSFTARFRRPTDAVDTAAGPLEELRGHTVLLAATESLGARFLVRQMESWGVRCERAMTAEQTLAIASASRPAGPLDVVLIDCHLEGMEGLELARQLSARAARHGFPIVGICHLGKRPGAAAMRAAGMIAALAKPVRQSELSSCLLNAIARAGELPRTVSRAKPPRRGIQLKRLREISESLPREARERARILVAEDHVVNRRVALKMLEQLGCRAQSVTNGLEAIEALAHTAYDIVLMDCQMPEMDGYEATREIRRRIGGTDKIAIIGLTAHALSGDRQKCLDAGMDDYLSKPFLPEDLAAMIAHWLSRDGAAQAREATAPQAVETPPREASSNAEPPAVDPEALSILAAADDGPDFVRQLIGVFLTDLDNRLSTMRSGAAADDAKAVAHAAHALKGSCGHFGAQRLVALCRELEALARSGATEGAAAKIGAIEHESARVRSALQTRLAPPEPRPAG